MDEKRPGRLKFVLLGGAAALVLAAFLLFGPPRLLQKSEAPEFCASCHVHEAQYEAWFHQGAHRREACIECHLPNENWAVHYAWKSVDGMKDLILFNAGHVPDDIRITDHGREVVHQNCIRCHSTTVYMIDQERVCTECHRNIMHKRSGAIATR